MIKIKNKKRFLLSLLLVFAMMVLIVSLLFSSYLNKSGEAMNPGDLTLVTITIPSGTSTTGIAEILKSENLIADSTLFQIRSKWEGNDGSYRAGEYELSAGMTMDEMMKIILSGRDSITRFTIPEGYDLSKTTLTLEAKGLIDAAAFQQELTSGEFDYRFVEELPKGENRLEGFLFPETYEIFTNTDEHDIIDKMLSQFDKMFTEERYSRVEELGMDLYDVIILASIIEREAVVSLDRPIISGVFQNRLKIGMPLQSCATVQYILGEQKPVLSEDDISIPNPYNTYLNTGLPPGPICSPGIESIDAVLWPAETDYLFFLAKGDGSHVFSITYDEHLRNKATYID
jgi:UPF0755 protein